MVATALKRQAVDTTQISTDNKVITFTRDIAGAAGDVAYTGVGFIPRAIIFQYSTTDAKCMGGGNVDSAKNMASYFSAQGAIYTAAVPTTGKCIYFSNAAGTDQQALLKTFDSDGFTLTWNKTGSPTGTGNVIAHCFR